MKKFICALLLLTTTTAFADGDAAYLPKGTPAPFEGYLLSPDKAKKVRLMDIDLQTCLKTSGMKDQEIDLSMKRIDNLTSSLDATEKRYQESKDSGFLSTVGIFLLGAATATVIAFAVNHATK